MQIAKLPAFNQGAFGPLVLALSEALADLRDGKNDLVCFEQLVSQQGLNPYCQMFVNEQLEIVIEINLGEFFDKGLTQWEESQFRLLGFLPPASGSKNYWKVFREGDSLMVQAKAIVEIFRHLFAFKESTPFSFGESEYSKSLATKFRIPQVDGEFQLLRLKP